ncbi:metallophosphoesterase family protein [Halalkalibacter urbisdiaboli]|uniref:metallophosphoesterase family protein n=1 Tax=Halalkalibacter urbisdiaboli TaxID=1960589 RepID=UPI000B43E3F2|nr:metallophosphoesterase [Halalkalibacter urbisdiaboli]
MKIVLIGDLHYPSFNEEIPGLVEARAAFYGKFIERFLEVDADAHVSLGDLTNFGYLEELNGIYTILNRRDRNFIHVLGNHDLYAQPRNEVLKITGQKRYHSIHTTEAIFAFLDTAKEMDYEDWGGWLDEEQLAWFEHVVEDSGTKPLLVFAHHPVHNTTKRSDREKGSIHPSIDMWKILNQKKGVGVYFNGHTHIDSIERKNNWTFVQLSACLDQHALRVVEVNQNEINISAKDILDKEIVENASLVYENMEHFTHQTDVRGEDSDRECKISLLSVTR